MKSIKTLIITAIIGASLAGCSKKTDVKPPVATISTWNTDANKYSTTNCTVSVSTNSLIAKDYTTGASITLTFFAIPTAQGDYTVTAPGMLAAGKVTVSVTPTKEISIDNGGTVFVFIKDGKLQVNFTSVQLGYLSTLNLGGTNTYTTTNHVSGFLFQN
ncbi:MAG: hypothetical protein ABI091_18390 [Ferruginibacter sp.]